MSKTATFPHRIPALLLMGLLATVPVQAATPPSAGYTEGGDSDSLLFPSSDYIRDLIARAQTALTSLGLYAGPISGEVDALLLDAIDRFQQRSGDTGSRVIDESLVDRLEASVNIGDLLDRLDKARARDIEAARAMLLANPETRGLIENKDAEEPANAARDVDACLVAPTPRCLLNEATESARSVSSPGRRDWALGEVLVSQVLTGLSADALQTTAAMSDPRLMIVALARIAEAEANAGRPQAAASALDMIPDEAERQTARIDVAAALSNLGNHKAALDVVGKLLAEDSDTDTLALQGGAKIATILNDANRATSAEVWLTRLTLSVRAMPPGAARDSGYKATANGYLAIGSADVALDLLERIESKGERNAVLIVAVHRLAELGRLDEAVTLANSIAGDRYKALGFADIANVLADTNPAGALEMLKRARETADEIRLPFARDFALSRIALTQARINTENAASVRELAEAIKDQELRAETLWQLRLSYGGAFANAANRAVDAINGDFNQGWLLAGTADRAFAADRDIALTLLERALVKTRDVKAPWARARLLARLATVLHRVEQ